MENHQDPKVQFQFVNPFLIPIFVVYFPTTLRNWVIAFPKSKYTMMQHESYHAEKKLSLCDPCHLSAFLEVCKKVLVRESFLNFRLSKFQRDYCVAIIIYILVLIEFVFLLVLFAVLFLPFYLFHNFRPDFLNVLAPDVFKVLWRSTSFLRIFLKFLFHLFFLSEKVALARIYKLGIHIFDIIYSSFVDYSIGWEIMHYFQGTTKLLF